MNEVSIIELLLLAIAVSLDIFAVSITLGMASCSTSENRSLRTPILLTSVSVLMLGAGWALNGDLGGRPTLGCRLMPPAMLIAIGLRTLRGGLTLEPESLSHFETATRNHLLPVLMTAAFTSFDSLVVGAALSVQDASLLVASCMFGTVTLGTSLAGYQLGQSLKTPMSGPDEITGGLALILVGFVSLV